MDLHFKKDRINEYKKIENIVNKIIIIFIFILFYFLIREIASFTI